MSRDEVGRPSSTRPGGRGAAAAEQAPAGPVDLDGTAGPTGPAGPGPPPARPPASGRRRARAALALLLAAGAGVGGTLLAVRAQEASDVRLVVVAAYPDPDRAGDPDQLSVTLLLAGVGAQDVALLGGGSGAPGGGTTGRVVPADAAWLPVEDAREPVVVPAGGTGGALLRLDASCDDPPPWEPWLRVRAGSGGEEVVELETVDGLDDDPLERACDLRAQTSLSPVSVVGRGSLEGQVSLSVSNTAAVPYRLRVDEGGVAGLSLVDDEVEVPPGRTAEVLLAVDPPRCAGALRADDLVGDAQVRAQRSGGDEDDGPPSTPVDLWVAESQVALAVGGACADP